jgi:hypothetical protein
VLLQKKNKKKAMVAVVAFFGSLQQKKTRRWRQQRYCRLVWCTIATKKKTKATAGWCRLFLVRCN